MGSTARPENGVQANENVEPRPLNIGQDANLWNSNDNWDQVLQNLRQENANKKGKSDFICVTNDGLVQKMVMIQGFGDKLTGNGLVVYHIAGWCQIGWRRTKFADSATGSPWKLDFLNGRDTVAGLYYAIKSMRTGEMAQIVVHPFYGYGIFGRLPIVPPHAILIYNIKIVKYEEQAKAHNIKFKDIRQKVWKLYLDGQKQADDGSLWRAAARSLQNGLDLLSKSTAESGAEAVEREHLEYEIKEQLAICCLELDSFQTCISLCKEVLRHDRNNADVLFTLAKAQNAKLMFLSAYYTLDKAVAAGYTGNDVDELKRKIITGAVEARELDPILSDSIFEGYDSENCEFD